ncbi:hypothetical protein GOP47_0013934 [Adiantum capillus-veneris]|uniref:Uncharacterized protein n=1 Tax=Adiantum capillus-veneris TaxID=13818 RepID=A0A9D4UPG7_ADICA|nr:hypothetical protein GOP47_0013934 [Adiantum capillus-veneris]
MSSRKIRHRKGTASEVAVENDDGVHGGRMKPLSSLGVSSAKTCFLAASNPSSQVHSLTRQGTKVMYDTISLNDGRRRATLRMHSRNTKSKSFNYKRLNHRAIDRKVAALPRQIKEMSHVMIGTRTCFREVAIPKKHPKLGARQAIELPSEMLRDNIYNAKSIKSLPSDAKSHRETTNPTSKAANDVAKRHNESFPYTAATSLQPAEEVFADIKTEKYSARLGKTMMKQGPASKISYSMDSKMMWTQFYKDRASDISNLGLTSRHQDTEKTER